MTYTDRKNSDYLRRDPLLNEVGTRPVQNPALCRHDICSGLRTELLPLGLPSLPSKYTLPSDSLLKYHLLDIQNVSVLTPTKLKLKPLQGSCQSGSNPMSQLVSHYSQLFSPNSPTRYTGVFIVLGICFALG